MERVREAKKSTETANAPRRPSEPRAGSGEAKIPEIKGGNAGKPVKAAAITGIAERVPQSRASETAAPGAASPTFTTDASALADRHSYLSVDRAFKAHLARLTFGLSPVVLAEQMGAPEKGFAPPGMRRGLTYASPE